MRLALSAAGLTACAVLIPTAAQATPARPPDHTPPTLTLPVSQYTLGTQLNNDGYYNYNVTWTWKASDKSKICDETVTYEDINNGEPVTHVDPSTRSFTAAVTGYLEAKSGVLYSLKVSVTDCAGNVSTSKWVDEPGGTVSDEQGRPGGVTEDTDQSITYRRAWGTTYFNGFSPQGPNATTHYSTERNASFIKSVTGGALALVMETKTDRGAVAIYVDGTQVAIVDTYAAQTVHRAVVWSTVLEPGTHTLRVVNLATSGRPRVDLDAIMN